MEGVRADFALFLRGLVSEVRCKDFNATRVLFALPTSPELILIFEGVAAGLRKTTGGA